MNEPSFSLLNQEEIDTLIEFLSNKQHNLQSDVLSQTSIDKLIQLIRNNDIHKMRLDALDSIKIRPAYDILSELHLRENPAQICELLFSMDESNGQVSLIAVNQDTNTQMPITPATLDRMEVINGSTTWGFSIVPILFDKIARIFSLKYSRKTYEDICALYALKNFGSEEVKLPSMYYPTSNDLLESLL